MGAINFFSINGTGGGGGGGPTVVNTENGIVGDGSLATPVKLGGTMSEFTDIQVPPTGNLRFIATDGANQFAHFEIDPVIIHADCIDISSGLGARFNIGFVAGDVVAQFSVFNNAVQQTGLFITNDNTPVVKDEINNVGLNGDVLFPVTGNPTQYAQYGNVAATFPISQNVAQVTTATPVIYTASLTSNQLIKVNAQAIITTFAAGVILTVSIDYTDTQGNARNVPLGVVNTAVPSAFPPVVLGVHDSNTVILSAILSGTPGGVFDLFGNVEVLGNIA